MYDMLVDFSDGIIYEKNEPGTCLDKSANRDPIEDQMDLSVFVCKDRELEEPFELNSANTNEELMLEPLYELKNGRIFWNQTTDGIAVLTNSLGCIVYSLNMEPQYLKKIMELRNRYKKAKARLHGSDDLAVIGRAVHECRVDTIFVEAGKSITGKYNTDTGNLEYGGMSDPVSSDIIEDIVKAVMKDKRDVIVLPVKRMPSDTGIAAIFRF